MHGSECCFSVIFLVLGSCVVALFWWLASRDTPSL